LPATEIGDGKEGVSGVKIDFAARKILARDHALECTLDESWSIR